MTGVPAGYRGHDEVIAALPAPIVVGYSRDGAPLHAVGFGPADATKVSIVIAGLHPIEWIGVEVALALIAGLAAAPPRDRRVIVLPLVNVDGYQAVEADLRAGRRRWRRGNAAAVDLNRNFPTAHRAASLRLPGWSWNRSGTGPASEPEVRAVLGAIDGALVPGARLARAVSLHSFGRMLLVPWAGQVARPARWSALEAAARGVASRLPERYRVVQTSRWLPGVTIKGAELDHFHAAYGALAVLVECSAGGVRIGDPASWVTPFRWYNPAAPRPIAAAIAAALGPFVRGADGVAD